MKGCGELVFENGINGFGHKDNIKCGTIWGGDQHFCKKCFAKCVENES